MELSSIEVERSGDSAMNALFWGFVCVLGLRF